MQAPTRNRVGLGDGDHVRMGEQALLDRIEPFHQVPHHRKHQDARPVVAQRHGPDVAQLPIHRHRADREHDCDRELNDHQGTPQPATPGMLAPRAAKCLGRSKGRQHERRPEAREDPGGQAHRHDRGDRARRADRHRLARERVERRQDHGHDARGDDQRDRGQQDGLAQELAHELRSNRPGRLPDPHLPLPERRPGRGQVHEVDARDGEDEERDRGQERHHGGVAVHAQLTHAVRVEVDVPNGLDLEADARGVRGRAPSRDQVGELGLQRPGLRAGTKPCIRRVVG